MKVAPREGVTPRCAICHDDAAEGPLCCPSCHTVVHAECRVGLPCPTLGCPHGPRGPVRERVVVLRPSLSEVVGSSVRALPRELVVAALVVLGLAGAVLGVNAAGPSFGSRVVRGRADLRAIGDAADLFRISRGHWPAAVDQLVEQGFLAERPRDPWGNAYELRPLVDGWEVVSAGEDGRFGTADDLSSRWSARR